MAECCNIDENLVPILYTYRDEYSSQEYISVSHFVCIKCLSNIICDDSFNYNIKGKNILYRRLEGYFKG